jgi:hypothetical protein
VERGVKIRKNKKKWVQMCWCAEDGKEGKTVSEE